MSLNEVNQQTEAEGFDETINQDNELANENQVVEDDIRDEEELRTTRRRVLTEKETTGS